MLEWVTISFSRVSSRSMNHIYFYRETNNSYHMHTLNSNDARPDGRLLSQMGQSSVRGEELKAGLLSSRQLDFKSWFCFFLTL